MEPSTASAYGALTPAQVDDFNQNGYLIVEDVFDVERDLAAVASEYEGVLDRVVNQLYDAGRLSSRYETLEFGERFTSVCVELNETIWPYFDISLPPGEITPDSPCHTGPAVFALLTHRRLLDVVESIMGPEIYSNPVQHVRVKLPQQGPAAGLDGTTNWHQDMSTLTEDAQDTEMLTVWSPLADTSEENGCLTVIPGSHSERLRHCFEESGIPESELPAEPIALPMRAGSVLLMHRRTAHAALPNQTDRIRFSFDLRYQPPSQPTGRASYPGFLARSSERPEDVLDDPAEWERMWLRARERLLGSSQKHGFELWETC